MQYNYASLDKRLIYPIILRKILFAEVAEKSPVVLLTYNGLQKYSAIQFDRTYLPQWQRE